jgi:hypothetical protein
MTPPKGLEEVQEIKESISNGNILGLIVGLAGVAFIGMTIYSMMLSIKVSKLNIHKLNAEGFN